eukprot:5523824-Amphidinium_carterae.1
MHLNERSSRIWIEVGVSVFLQERSGCLALQWRGCIAAVWLLCSGVALQWRGCFAVARMVRPVSLAMWHGRECPCMCHNSESETMGVLHDALHLPTSVQVSQALLQT